MPVGWRSSRELLIAWESAYSLKKREEPVFRCVFCKERIFKRPVLERRTKLMGDGLVQQVGPYVLSGEAAFHFYDTHGFDPETFLEMLRKVLKRVYPPT